MDTAGPSKKAKLQPKLTLNVEHEKLQSLLRENWNSETTFTEDGKASVSSDPFLHVEMSGFITETEFLQDLVKKIDEVKLVEKSSDLFKFKQSNDLVSVQVPEVQSLKEFFESTVLDFLTEVTGLPLDGKVDMFLSEYVRTDFLLCHDDELESRRIAFILYLSEDWDAVYGGSLDLFASTEHIEPLHIVKSITPAFNKFVFFNVTSKSFHQVAEVVSQNARRLAVSGWFYGEPLARPVLNFPGPETFSIRENLSPNQNFENLFTEEYLSPANYSAINASLEEYSIAKLKLLIRPEKYDTVLTILETNKIQWKQKGPANLCSFYSPTEPLLPILSESSFPPVFHDLIQVFFSKKFYEFLEKVTEFDLLVDTSRVNCSLKKFQHKNYILLKDQVNNSNTVDNHEDEDEGEEWEIADEEEGETEDESPEIDETKVVGTLASEPAMTNGVPTFAEQEDEDVDLQNGDDEDEDNESDEREIDVIYYFGDFSWKETFGGQTVYVDSTGQQLLTVTPEPNTMAIVVREKGVTPYVSYINCLAGQQLFHALSLTISGFKETD